MQPGDNEPEFQGAEDMIVGLAEFGFNLVCAVVTIFWQFILAVAHWATGDDA